MSDKNFFDSLATKDEQEEKTNDLTKRMWVVGSITLLTVYLLCVILSCTLKVRNKNDGKVGEVQRNDFNTSDTISV